MSRKIRVLAEGVLKNVSGIKVRVAGAWKNMSKFRVYESGAWKDVFPYAAPLPPPSPPSPPAPPPPAPPTLSVTCDPIGVNGSDVGGGTINTGGTTATITGGTAPYTQIWECASWSSNFAAPPNISSPTALVTYFYTTDIAEDDIGTATFRITVRDANGLSAVNQVDATFYRYSRNPHA